MPILVCFVFTSNFERKKKKRKSHTSNCFAPTNWLNSDAFKSMNHFSCSIFSKFKQNTYKDFVISSFTYHPTAKTLLFLPHFKCFQYFHSINLAVFCCFLCIFKILVSNNAEQLMKTKQKKIFFSFWNEFPEKCIDK